jgi:subtilisin family serine protease
MAIGQQQKNMSLEVEVPNDFWSIPKEIIPFSIFRRFGNNIYIQANLSQVKQWTRNFGFRKVSYLSEGRALMDSARIYANIDSIHLGINLPKEYLGDSVLIGVIDLGIDVTHPDFIRADRSHKIYSVWDQKSTVNLGPNGFSYGKYWDSASIVSKSITYRPNLFDYSHGTGVTGIAAGSGQIDDKVRGAAPNAWISFVDLKSNENFMVNLLNGIEFLIAEAKKLQLPLIINISMGTYNGSHDGQDLVSQQIDSILLANPATIIVAAAGNAGNIKQHSTIKTGDNQKYAYFSFTPSYNGTFVSLWADKPKSLNPKILISIDSGAQLHNISETIELNLDTLIFTKLSQNLQSFTNMLPIYSKDKSRKIADLQYYGLLQGDAYNVQFYALNKANTHLKLQFEGNYHYDIWCNPSLVQHSTLLANSAIPNDSVAIKAQYMQLDTLMSIVSGFQCLDRVLTIGNFRSRDGYRDVDGNLRLTNNNLGNKEPNSSVGPTRDGRIKPDLVAPGNTIISTVDSITAYQFLNSGDRFKLISPYYARFGGTSSASPLVAGGLALVRQRYPKLTRDSICKMLIAKANPDKLINNQPNNEYGYGKVNFYPLLIQGNIKGCMDSTNIKYNPNANLNCCCDSSTQSTSEAIDFSVSWDELYQKINLKTSHIIEKNSLLLSDLLGRKKSFDLLQTKNGYQIDIKELQNGYYLLLYLTTQTTYRFWVPK